MLINLNGNIVNYNNIQSVTPDVIHLDFIEGNFTDEMGNEYVEIKIIPKVEFSIAVYQPASRKLSTEQFFISSEGCNLSYGEDGSTSHKVRNGLTPVPYIKADPVSGTFFWQGNIQRRLWLTKRIYDWDDDFETFAGPSKQEIKDFKTQMWTRVRRGMPLLLLQAVNKMVHECSDLQ